MNTSRRKLRIGVYSPFFGSTVGGGEKYLGVTAEAIRDAFPGHEVDLIGSAPADRQLYERMLKLDLGGINLRSTNQRVTGAHRLLNNVKLLRPLRGVMLGSQAARFTRGYDLFLSMVYVIPAASRARKSVILCQFPYEIDSSFRGGRYLPGPLARVKWLVARGLHRIFVGDNIGQFQMIICQSDYVRHWVSEYWHRNALVINPPIDIPDEEPDWSAKDNIVLSVGRFFTGGHAKRQDLMVQAFRQLCDEGLQHWELHLAGSVHRTGHNAGYFESIAEMARGYPIHLHPDVPYEEVQDLYRRASIYWHAAGYGVDPQAAPIDFEHFGMTTAEAMGHGTVPIAIAAGGQVEVVHDGDDGYLWRETDDLKRFTRELAADPGLRRRRGTRARENSARFSRGRFAKAMAEALAPLVAELEAGTSSA